MAIPRKRALDRLQELLPLVEEHLDKAIRNPGHSSVKKWQNEALSWLRQMEACLPHVGKKTAAQWQARIQTLLAKLQG